MQSRSVEANETRQLCEALDIGSGPYQSHFLPHTVPGEGTPASGWGSIAKYRLHLAGKVCGGSCLKLAKAAREPASQPAHIPITPWLPLTSKSLNLFESKFLFCEGG